MTAHCPLFAYCLLIRGAVVGRRYAANDLLYRDFIIQKALEHKWKLPYNLLRHGKSGTVLDAGTYNEKFVLDGKGNESGLSGPSKRTIAIMELEEGLFARIRELELELENAKLREARACLSHHNGNGS